MSPPYWCCAYTQYIWLLHPLSLASILWGYQILTWWLTIFRMYEATWGLITFINAEPRVPQFINFFFYCWKENTAERGWGKNTRQGRRRGIIGDLGIQTYSSPFFFSKVESEEIKHLSIFWVPLRILLWPLGPFKCLWFLSGFYSKPNQTSSTN